MIILNPLTFCSAFPTNADSLKSSCHGSDPLRRLHPSHSTVCFLSPSLATAGATTCRCRCRASAGRLLLLSIFLSAACSHSNSSHSALDNQSASPPPQPLVVAAGGLAWDASHTVNRRRSHNTYLYEEGSLSSLERALAGRAFWNAVSI